MTDAQQALARILDPAFLEDLDDRSLADVRSMHTECVELENSLSYVRRLVQGRLDILTAEAERRSTGGSIDELVASLPEILADEESRPPPTETRVVPQFAPADTYELPPDVQRLVTDETLARLPELDDDEVRNTVRELGDLEKKLSSDRRALHEVIDRVERELAARLVVEA